MTNEAWMTLLGHIFPKSFFFPYSSSCFIALTRQQYASSPLHLDTRQWLQCLLTKEMILSLWKLTAAHLPSFVHLNVTTSPGLAQGLPGSFCWTLVWQSGKKAHCKGKHVKEVSSLSVYMISPPLYCFKQSFCRRWIRPSMWEASIWVCGMPPSSHWLTFPFGIKEAGKGWFDYSTISNAILVM